MLDKGDRILYDKNLHENRGRTWLFSELVYLCSMHKKKKIRIIALFLERTEGSCVTKIMDLKKSGDYERYKRIGDSKF